MVCMVEVVTEADVHEHTKETGNVVTFKPGPFSQRVYMWTDEDGFHSAFQDGTPIPYEPEETIRKDGEPIDLEEQDELPSVLR